MSIVMGLDQHRAQITGEWIDTETGEVRRGRVAPADRAGVRRFLERFRGQELEVALEATTGWRFVVEELRAIGAGVHLAEPAETAGLRGPKKRAKSDRADARHLRELLMIKRLPESWIPPDHILDLRARVRLRHTLSEQRGEWQQRIQAILYHHGCPQRRSLMTGDGRAWLAAQPLPRDRARAGHGRAGDDRRARGCRSRRSTSELRAYARRQAGCKALMAPLRDRRADRGHDPRRAGRLPAVLLLAARGPLRRAWTSPCTQSDQRRSPGHLSRQGPPALRWALFEAAQVASRPGSARIATTTSRPPSGSAPTARAWRSRASCSSAATTRCASSARRHSHPHELPRARTALITQMRRGRLPACSCRHDLRGRP